MISDEKYFIDFDAMHLNKNEQEILCEICSDNDWLRPYGCKINYCETKQKNENREKERIDATKSSNK